MRFKTYQITIHMTEGEQIIINNVQGTTVNEFNKLLNSSSGTFRFMINGIDYHISMQYYKFTEIIEER